MIRVNLLAAASGLDSSGRWPVRGQRTMALGLALVLLTAVVAGGRWWKAHHDRKSVETRIASAETRLAHLRQLAATADRAAARKSELASRLASIDQLRVASREPIRLLAAIGQSVPDGLWLIELKQAGAAIRIDGRAASLAPVTDFANRLQTSGAFRQAVEILTASSEAFEGVAVVRFSLRAGTPLLVE